VLVPDGIVQCAQKEVERQRPFKALRSSVGLMLRLLSSALGNLPAWMLEVLSVGL